MTTATIPRPEVRGALALAARHLATAERWRWTTTRRGGRYIKKHRDKARKLLARAARLGCPDTLDHDVSGRP